MVSLRDLMLWVRALNVMWHGLSSVACCAFRGPMSLEACASMGKLTGLMDVVDGKSFMRGLALMPGLSPDDRLIACDDTTWRWMVLLLMCSLSYRVLPMTRTLLRM